MIDKAIKPEFVIVPRALYENRHLRPVDLIVFGVIYWMSQLSHKKFTASTAYIAAKIAVSDRTIPE